MFCSGNVETFFSWPDFRSGHSNEYQKLLWKWDNAGVKCKKSGSKKQGRGETHKKSCRLTVQSEDGKFGFVIPEYKQASELLKKSIRRPG